mmetsp:Transcript_11632/g.16589  ORF Transcript_11632/g.16589 Transcript_11632/m.16589 type:complete len:130 (+) Transcript_11632:940-1329(+)
MVDQIRIWYHGKRFSLFEASKPNGSRKEVGESPNPVFQGKMLKGSSVKSDVRDTGNCSIFTYLGRKPFWEFGNQTILPAQQSISYSLLSLFCILLVASNITGDPSRNLRSSSLHEKVGLTSSTSGNTPM